MMLNPIKFDLLIVVTPQDCRRLMPLYPRLIDCFHNGRICFVGSAEVGEIVSESKVADKAYCIDENELISFNDVNNSLKEKLKFILHNKEMPRAVTGWYYQQFLKMQYSKICTDDYYMVWDGDTIPCRDIEMFQSDGFKPYLDMKHEFHPEYFDTISAILPGLKKAVQRSFISEHMLIKKDIMLNMIDEIEKNDSLHGHLFWEKIFDAIPAEKVTDSSFSEFETYGTYVAYKYPEVYKLRDWHSFRLGSQFYEVDKITDKDFLWLSKDFNAISFEKNQPKVIDEINFFNNPYYQERLSAKQILQAFQMEFNGGYKEIWADDQVTLKNANVTIGKFKNGKSINNRTLFIIVNSGNEEMLKLSVDGIKESLSELNYKIIITDYKLSYYKAINEAIKKARESAYCDWDICLIKSGTRILYDSIHFLKQAMYSDEKIGAVGSISNLAGNKQKLDMGFDTEEDYLKFGEQNNVLMESPYLERVSLSSCLIMIKSEVFDRIGYYDEEYDDCNLACDVEYSIRILKNGYRLRLVRNSFIYRAIWDENEDTYISKGSNYFKYIYADSKVLGQIPFSQSDKFSVLEIQCGLGANLKAIRSLYKNAQVTGIETDKDILLIASKTENVYQSLTELKQKNAGLLFDLILINNEDFNLLSYEEQKILGEICNSEFKVLAK